MMYVNIVQFIFNILAVIIFPIGFILLIGLDKATTAFLLFPIWGFFNLTCYFSKVVIRHNYIDRLYGKDSERDYSYFKDITFFSGPSKAGKYCQYKNIPKSVTGIKSTSTKSENTTSKHKA